MAIFGSGLYIISPASVIISVVLISSVSTPRKREGERERKEEQKCAKPPSTVILAIYQKSTYINHRTGIYCFARTHKVHLRRLFLPEVSYNLRNQDQGTDAWHTHAPNGHTITDSRAHYKAFWTCTLRYHYTHYTRIWSLPDSLENYTTAYHSFQNTTTRHSDWSERMIRMITEKPRHKRL
jgi:hypothetical protein